MKSLTVLAILLLAATTFAQRSESHNYDLLDVNWKLSYDFDQRRIEGDVTNLVQLTGGGDSVWFDCGPLDIATIAVNDQSARFKHEGERLTVELPGNVKRGDRLRVRIQYSGQPTAGIYFVDGSHAYPGKTHMVYTQGEAEDTRYWIPTYDYPDDKATAQGTITVPAGEYVLSNGKLLGIDKTPSTWTYRWKISEPISTYLISMVAGPYVEQKESLGKLPVTWISPPGTESWSRAAFQGTNKNIEFYNKLTGFNYPFEKFSQSAVADYMFGGMENASCVTQTIHTLHKPSNEPIANSAGLVAHELAHQWFGDTITCADWSHAWLNEGFASFLPAFWERERHGRNAYDISRFDTFVGAVASLGQTHRPVVSKKYEIPMDIFDGQIYGGGAARLFTLMGQLGEKPFWAGVKRYLNEYKFKNATTEDFFRVMSKSTGKDLDNFRKQFFYTDGVPDYKVSREGSEIVIRQKEPFFDLDLTLSMLSRNDIQKEFPAHINGPETRIDIKGYEDDLFVLDYRVSAMARITYQANLSSQDLLRIWWLAPNAAAKMVVLGRFFPKVSQEDMLDVVREEKSPDVQGRIIDALRGEEAVPLLEELSRSFDRTIALRATAALARFTKNQEAQDRLKEIWTREKNEYIANAALGGLLQNAKDGSLAAEAWLTKSEWEMHRQAALAWWTDHDPKNARERSLKLLDEGVEPLRLAAIKTLGRVKDEKGSRRVYQALLKVAGEPSFAARTAAVNALVEYGDPAAISTIRPLAKSSLFFLRRTAEAAIAALEKSKREGS